MREFVASIALAATVFGVLMAPELHAARKDLHLHLCNPAGGLRADRVPEGLRIRYMDKRNRERGLDFVMPDWEVRSMSSKGKEACVEIYKKGSYQGTGVLKDNPESTEVLSAKDEVIVYGGAFQDKVILRRTKRVIDLGGERIIVEGTTVLQPEKKKRTKQEN
jgi:hypothetical protein